MSMVNNFFIMNTSLMDMNFLEQKLKLEQKKQKTWKLFFKKFANNDQDDFVYSVNEIPEDEHKGSMIWSEMELIELVENEMKSNLKQLMLKREKAKVFANSKDYNVFHPQMVKEIKRLRKKLTKDDLRVYIEICVIPDDETVKIIEKNLHSKLKTMLMNKIKYLNLASEPYYQTEFKKNLQKEWNYLKTVISEEEIIKYAVMIQKKYQSDVIDF